MATGVPSAAPPWVSAALAEIADACAASAAHHALVVAPYDIDVGDRPPFIGSARRDEDGTPARQVATQLATALSTATARETLVAFVDCFAEATDADRVAAEIASIADVCHTVAVVESADLVDAPLATLRRAGVLATSRRGRQGLHILRGDPAPTATDAAPAPPRAPAAPTVVLCYHRVLPDPSDDPFGIAVSTATFDSHLRALNERFCPTALSDLRPRDGDASSRARVVVTFDDGYRDVYDHAFPLLRRHATRATLFVATGFVGDRRPFWWDVLAECDAYQDLDAGGRAELQDRFRFMAPDDRDRSLHELSALDGATMARLADKTLASWDALIEMESSGIVELGAHTRDHPSLGRLDRHMTEDQVASSLDELGRRVGRRPRTFAYPHGGPDDVGPECARILAELGVDFALTTSPGWFDAEALTPGGAGALALPRMIVQDVPASTLVSEIETLLPTMEPALGRRRITVLSGISADNLGDDAMLIATVEGVRRHDPEADVTVVAESPESCEAVAAQLGSVPIVPSPQRWVQAILAAVEPGSTPSAVISGLAQQINNHRATIVAGLPVPGLPPDVAPGLRAIMGADGVVDCGGANLSPHWASYFYEKCLDYLVAAQPLFVSGQGVDRLDDVDDERLLAHALSRADAVTLREPVSRAYLKELGVTGNVATTGDDALTLQPATQAERARLLASVGLPEDEPYLALQFRHYLDYAEPRFLDLMARFVDAAAEATGLPIVGVPMHFSGTDERDHLEAVARRTSQPRAMLPIRQVISPAEAKALLGGARAAFGISYHSAVLAMSSGTPFVGLYEGDHYEQKMKGLEALFDVEGMALRMNEQPARLGRRLSRILDDRERMSEHLRRRTEALTGTVEASRVRFSATSRLSADERRRPERGAVDLGDLRRLAPVSRQWGFDRGLPVDRYYIDGFLERHRHCVRGTVCELLNDEYASRLGQERVDRVEILDIDAANPRATIVDDLTSPRELGKGRFDCFLLTQTLPYIYDCGAALGHAYRALAPGGDLLVTVPSIIKFHREPEDHWRFTPDSIERLANERCPKARIVVESHGNVLAATAFLHGLATEEIESGLLDVVDPEFPLVVTACISRPKHEARV